jgi:putative transposase
MSFHIDATKHRRSIRLKGYDYSKPGAYFVTIVTHERKCLFGKIEDGAMRFKRCGTNGGGGVD